MATIQFPVLGVDDLDRAVRFWCALLDLQPSDKHRSARWCTLEDRDNAVLGLQLSTTPVQPRPRMHLDVAVHGVEDQQATAARVRELGGQVVDWDQWPEDPDFIVVADTEGNRFCLVDVDHVDHVDR
ncbi:MAG TPA: VOC family protein [Jatrophihabitans sp.]|nr:VOC family protein [Jatrophihabitans sp.]